MELASITCCFTGHRKIPLGAYESLTERLRETIIQLVKESIMYFRTVGALGFDKLAAKTVLAGKQEYPQMKLILVLPSQNQTKGWRTKDIAVYEKMKRQSDQVIDTAKEFTPDCMKERN